MIQDPLLKAVLKRAEFNSLKGKMLGNYLFTEDGEVYSTVFKNGTTTEKRIKKIKLCLGTNGYLHFDFYESGKRKNLYVHQAMTALYHGPKPMGMYAAHLDGDRFNNKASNLKWVTPKENQFHRRDHGTVCFGEKNGGSKLKEADVFQIHDLKGKVKIKDISNNFKVSEGAIYSIWSGKSWAHIFSIVKSRQALSTSALEKLGGGDE